MSWGGCQFSAHLLQQYLTEIFNNVLSPFIVFVFMVLKGMGSFNLKKRRLPFKNSKIDFSKT